MHLILWTLLACVLHADVVNLKNGDRVTGVIVKKDGDKLTIKADLMGDVTVPWAQVESVKADKPLFVTLPGGKIVEGQVSSSGDRLEIGVEAVPLQEIGAIRNEAEQRAWQRLQNPSILELWTGTGTLGFAGTAGNARTQTLTTAVTAVRQTLTDKTSLYFNAIQASALIAGRNADTAQAVRGGIGYARNFTPKLFVSMFNDYEYDRFQNLDLRFVLGGGLGYQLKRTNRTKLDLLGGIAYNRESFNTPLIRNSAEAYWGNEFSFRLNSLTTLTQSYRMFNNLTNTGVYRINFDAGATTRLTRWLSWNLAISDRFLSNPVPGRKKNDFIYTTGIGILFSR